MPPPGVHEMLIPNPDFRVYVNPDAWPEAFFVDTLPTAPVPRLADCAHDRLLCADFSGYRIGRLPDPVRITRFGDGVRLSFAPGDSVATSC